MIKHIRIVFLLNSQHTSVSRWGFGMLLGLWVIAAHTSTWAQTARAASLLESPDIDVLHQQEVQHNTHKQQQRIQQLRQTPTQSLKEPPPVSTPPKTASLSSDCLPYRWLRLELSHHISQRSQNQLRSHIPKGCINQAVLLDMQRRVAQAYLKQGYFRLQLQQRKHDGGLIWNAAPATVHAVRNKTKINSQALLPHAIGKAANIQDLDQALDQANRLPNRKVTIDVYPNAQGDIAVALSEQSEKPWRGMVGIDAQSNRSTGTMQATAYLAGGNLLGIADAFDVHVVSSLPAKRQRYVRAGFLRYSVPYGYWTFTANAAATAYRTQAQLAHIQIPQSGNSHSASLRAERVISRGARHITSVHGQLSRKSVDNRIFEQKIEVQSAELAVAAVGIQHTQLLPRGSIHAQAEIHKGLHILGAQRHIANSGLPNPQFTKVHASIDWTHVHPIGKNKKKRVRVVHQLAGQYGRHSLPNIEQFSAGDRYSVRGTEAPLSGDSGAWLRNTAYLDIATAGKLSVHPYLGFDAGYIQWKNQQGKRQAASATMGLMLQHAQWDLNVSVSRARARGVGIEGKQLDTQWHGALRWLF